MSTDDRMASQEARDETPAERADRNLDELLQELRIALPGVQVLFAFLFSVPFAQRFAEVTSFQEGVYFVTLLCSAVATALLIAPSAYHRLNFQQGDKRHIVRVANAFAIAGFVALALAMTGAVLLVTGFVFDGLTMAVGVSVTALAIALLWFVAPLARRMQTDRRRAR